MLTNAIEHKVPFITINDLPKFNNSKLSTEELYEIPDVDCLQDYHKGIQQIVKKHNAKYVPSPEEFYFLFRNYVHISANFNEAQLTSTKGKETLDNNLYVNHPTDDMKRVIIKP